MQIARRGRVRKRKRERKRMVVDDEWDRASRASLEEKGLQTKDRELWAAHRDEQW